MKRIVEPFCVIYLLLPIGLFSSCARKPPGASLPLSTFTFWQAGIVLLLLLMTSLSIILHYRYRRMKTRIQKEKEMAYLEACRIVELEKQKVMQLANKLIEEKKEMVVQQARAIIEQVKEEARQLQAQVTITSVMLANKTDYLLQLQEKLKAADNTDCRRIAKENFDRSRTTGEAAIIRYRRGDYVRSHFRRAELNREWSRGSFTNFRAASEEFNFADSTVAVTRICRDANGRVRGELLICGQV